MGELVHHYHSSKVLTLPVAFRMASLSTFMYMAAVSQLVLSEQVWMGNEVFLNPTSEKKSHHEILLLVS